MAGPSIYDLLAQQQISELTVDNLNKATQSTAIASKNIDFWSGIITVARALEESRTYAHGLVIPETGTIAGGTIADGANATFTPTGSEVWRVEAIFLNGCTAALKDGDGNSMLMAAASDALGELTAPLMLSATMQLVFDNASGSPANPRFAYHKVSL